MTTTRAASRVEHAAASGSAARPHRSAGAGHGRSGYAAELEDLNLPDGTDCQARTRRRTAGDSDFTECPSHESRRRSESRATESLASTGRAEPGSGSVMVESAAGTVTRTESRSVHGRRFSREHDPGPTDAAGPGGCPAVGPDSVDHDGAAAFSSSALFLVGHTAAAGTDT